MSGPPGVGFSTRRLQQAPGCRGHGPGHAPECDHGPSHELRDTPLLALTLESNRWGSEVWDCLRRGAPKGPSFRVWWLLMEVRVSRGHYSWSTLPCV